MPQHVKINDRYEHIPDTGTHWRILDTDNEWDEVRIPKRFAPLPEVAVELLEYVAERQEVAMRAGFESGRRSLQYDLRKLLGAAPNPQS
ncbi:hypothetical protein K3725_09690 [Leisingera sp. S132]|uniref:hypothetical protein n=1 Tax=Leisingera sp. S132 TaxID=2867016 RepID=UPI0021A5EFA8|nr:hypothetical protein [Leisingera sp. S132]UWQ77595.1 hypothetical protein K3725_09690 [Leisingera sp. S132]